MLKKRLKSLFFSRYQRTIHYYDYHMITFIYKSPYLYGEFTNPRRRKQATESK